MKKLNKKSIVFSSGIIAVLALSLILTPFNNALAGNCFGNGSSASSGSFSFGSPTETIITPIINVPTIISETKNQSDLNVNTSNLASNAISGSNGFMPSRLIEWLFLGIIILLMVILIRKFYGAEDRYHSTPLKHA